MRGPVPFHAFSTLSVACLLDPSLPIMIKKLEEKVEFVLRKYPETKDNDQMLVSLVWMYHLGRDRTKDLSAWELLTMLSRKELPNFESIRRSRQKLQELNAELRGETYKDRHKYEVEVKDEIKNWTGKLF